MTPERKREIRWHVEDNIRKCWPLRHNNWSDADIECLLTDLDEARLVLELCAGCPCYTKIYSSHGLRCPENWLHSEAKWCASCHARTALERKP